MMGTTWADVSQYQGIPIDDTYPHRVFCFRTNSGDKTDTLAVENARRALDMLTRGRLDAVFPYYFFRPGQANCDLHREILKEVQLWGHPRVASMIDVEDAGGVITGDQSAEVNDEAERMVGWYGLDQRRVFGYWNPVANPGLWRTRPPWLRLVVPSYGRTPGQPHTKPPGFFAHQYTDAGRCAPWPNGVDLNFTDLDLPELLASFGFQGGTAVADPVTEGAAQLHPFPNLLRQINKPENVNCDDPADAWPYAMWTDLWNETVWDGFELPAVSDDDAKSLLGWTLDNARRLRSIEAKLDRLLGGK